MSLSLSRGRKQAMVTGNPPEQRGHERCCPAKTLLPRFPLGLHYCLILWTVHSVLLCFPTL